MKEMELCNYLLQRIQTKIKEGPVVNVFTGASKGEGSFAIFANTLKYILEHQYVDIDAKIDEES
jgi:hypothetical protein